MEDVSCFEFDESRLALMWDKKKGKPKYENKKSKTLWLGPHIVNKNSQKGGYFLATTDGRKIPLLVDGSILQHYINET
jgi:hypothetical protein